jgi:hypothetical protein
MTRRYATISFTKLPLSHAGFVRILTLGFLTHGQFVRIPNSAIFSFDHFLPGLYPAFRPKIRIFCPDRDMAFSAIAGGPTNSSDSDNYKSHVIHGTSLLCPQLSLVK